MAQAFHQYSPDLVVFSWGSIIATGFTKGTFLTCKRDEDAYSKKTGATGDVVRVRNLNRGGSFEIVIDQGSITNDQLSAAYAIDQAFNSFQTQPALLKDLNGTTLVHAEKAWLKKISDIEFSEDVSARKWVFDCAAMNIHIVGGAIV